MSPRSYARGMGAAAPVPPRLERLERWGRAHPDYVDLLLAIAVGLSLSALSVSALAELRPGAAWAAVHLAAGLVVDVALAARRRAPAASFAAVSLALAVGELTPGLTREQPFLPSAVAFPFALYSYCVHGGPRAPRRGALVGAAGALLIAGRWLVETPAADRGTAEVVLGGLLLLGFLLAVVAAAECLGLFRTVRSVYLTTLEERTRLAETEREERAARAVRAERDRIAREMHDVVAHSLSIIVSQAQGGAYVAGTRPDRAARALETIAETGREALADMRGLLGVLLASAPSAGDDAPQPGLADLPDLLAGVRATGLRVSEEQEGTPRRLGAAAGLAVYRLVQESLTNALKHAGPDATAQVRLVWTDEELVVSVCDDGVGVTPGDGGGHGLIGMRERIAVLGGSTTAEPRPGGGFLVEARLPLPLSLPGDVP